MEKKAMNVESIIKQFQILESSIKRAKLPFETDMLQKEVIEVSLYELIKSYHQIENMVREIDPERFGVSTATVTHHPELAIEHLYLCPFCGNPKCQSDHK